MSKTGGVYKWSSIDRVLNTVITFGGNLALARMLSPGDFGLLAMVGIFTAIAQNLSSCGMSDGLIRKPSPSADDYSTVFTFNLLAGIFFSIIFVVSAAPLASYFGQPDLQAIMWAIAFCFVFQTMSFVQETRLRKHLDMKRIAIVHISSSAAAIGLGIVLAATGFGFWGLVSCRVFVAFFLFVFYVIATRWIPRPRICRKSFNEMFGYGINLMWAYMINQIGRNVNTFVLGKISAPQAGIFSQGQKMEDVPFTVTDSIFNWPFFAVLSNERDPLRRQTLCHEMLRGLSMVAVTIGCLLMLLGEPGFHLAFGEKWDAAVPVFRVLIIFGISSTLKGFFQTVLKANGLTRTVRNLAFAELALQLGLLALVVRLGMTWIAWSQVAASVTILIFLARRYCKVTSIGFFAMARLALSRVPVPLAAFTVTAGGYWLWNGVYSSLVSCLLVLLTYSAIAIVLWEIFPNPFYTRYRTAILNRLRSRRIAREIVSRPEDDDFLGQ